LATPRSALRAQAVLSARTWPRFLLRNLARADEKNARVPETPRDFGGYEAPATDSAGLEDEDENPPISSPVASSFASDKA